MRQLQYSNFAKNPWLKNYGFLHRGMLRLTHVAKKHLLNIIPFIIKQPRPFTLRLALVAVVLGFGLWFVFGLTVISAVFITGIILSIYFFAATLLYRRESHPHLFYLFAFFINKIFYAHAHEDEIHIGMQRLMPIDIRFSLKTGFNFLWSTNDAAKLFNQIF
jgi:hypothetical protein